MTKCMSFRAIDMDKKAQQNYRFIWHNIEIEVTYKPLEMVDQHGY